MPFLHVFTLLGGLSKTPIAGLYPSHSVDILSRLAFVLLSSVFLNVDVFV